MIITYVYILCVLYFRIDKSSLRISKEPRCNYGYNDIEACEGDSETVTSFKA